MVEKDKFPTKTVCINQLIKPKESIPEFLRPKGMGDCATCKTCRKNLGCTGFTPVSIGTFNVEEDV